MVTYEITASVDASLCEAYERYMRRRHIPDVLGSECFRGAVLTSATPGGTRNTLEVRVMTSSWIIEAREAFDSDYRPPIHSAFR